MTANQDITLYAKRDNTLDITIQTNAGNPVDLTDYKVVMTVKALLTDADSAALYHGIPTFANAPFGRLSFLVPLVSTSQPGWAATGTGVYDVTAITPTNYAVTLLSGNVTIVEPVTQTPPSSAPPLNSFMLNALSPNTNSHTGSPFTLTCDGSGFVEGSVIVFNGVAEVTTYLSANQLSATITLSGYTASQQVNVVVQNPDLSVTNPLIFTFS